MSKKLQKFRTLKHIFLTGLFAIVVIASMPGICRADDLVSVRINDEPPMPPPVRNELTDIFRHTLTEVLFDGADSDNILESDPVQLAGAIRTGINIVIEPKGYSVNSLDLNTNTQPVEAVFVVRPLRWTESDPDCVTGVDVVMEPDGLDSFWIDRFSARLQSDASVHEAIEANLIGLPVSAVDPDWSVNLVLPHFYENDSLKDLFPGFEISYEIELHPTASLLIKLTPSGDIIERLRPRMFSMTLPNVLMDRFRERLLAEADFIAGIPRNEIDSAADEISQRLVAACENDPLAEDFNASVTVTVRTLDNEPVAQIDAFIESRSFDLKFEAYIDFGNEERDSSEIQCRLGFILTKGVEIFSNLNYFTNDSALDTDFGLGLRPQRGSFVGVGYDIDREFWKYYAEQELFPGFSFRAEIFEDDELNEFGIIYQFQQYLAGGAYTNGNDEFWVRAIFEL